MMTNPGFQAAQAAQRAAQANQQAAQRAVQANQQAAAQAGWSNRQAREANQRAGQDAARFRQGFNSARPRPSSGGPIGRLVGVVVMVLIAAFAAALMLTVASHIEPGWFGHLITWLQAHL